MSKKNRWREGKISVSHVLLIFLAIAALVVIYLRLSGNKDGTESKTNGKTGVNLDRPIRVGIVTWGGYAGGVMANNGFDANQNCDFYRNYGIEVDLKVIDDFVESRSAFKAGGDKGGIDIVWGTVDAYALEYPALKLLGVKCIMQYDWSRGGDAIAVDGNIIRTAKDLKGKTIAVAEDTPSHYFALFVLSEAGLRPSDINWRFVNSAIDAANVFKAGKVDAAVSWSPDVYIAARERSGGKILMSTREATNLIADIFIARGDFIEKYPEEIERFIKGWHEGVDKVHQNPEPVIKLMAKGFNLPEDDSRAMLGDVHLPNYPDNMAFFDSFSPIGYDAIYNNASKIWKDLGKISEIAPPKETRQTIFLTNVADNFKGQKRVDPIIESGYVKKGTGEEETLIEKQVTINFVSNAAELDVNAQADVRNKIAGFVATYGGCFVSIEGNTDNTGAYQHNKVLSEQRAASVRDFLIKEFNMPADRFEIKGNAWDKPWDGLSVIESNATDSGKAKNRRTDIVIKTNRN